MSPSAPAPSICDIRGPLMIGPSGLHATLTGPVEARYIERNAIGVANALAAADMALAGIQSVVPSDEVILALRNVQTLLPMELREHDPRRAGEHADRASVERRMDGPLPGRGSTPGVSVRPKVRAEKGGCMETLLLSQKQIEQLVTMKDVVEVVEKTFKGMGEGTVVNPTKVGLDLGEVAPWPPYKGFMNAMPAYVGWQDSAGIKWAGGFLDNYKIGLPYISSLIMLIDPKNGQFRAVVDGALITNLRTGAQSAVALKYLHPEKRLRLGLFGAGAQGRTQTRAAAELFDIQSLKVYDIRREAAEAFAREMRPVVKGTLTVVDSPEQVADAEAIICVTQSKDKFVKESWLKPGMILFPMGSYQECEDACILKADKIVVDHIGQCLHRGALKELTEAGQISERSIYSTIGEIVAGKKPARSAASDRILCIPIGTGAMDITVATLAYQRALEKGLGGRFAFV